MLPARTFVESKEQVIEAAMQEQLDFASRFEARTPFYPIDFHSELNFHSELRLTVAFRAIEHFNSLVV
jgi:hypothetical protein